MNSNVIIVKPWVSRGYLLEVRELEELKSIILTQRFFRFEALSQLLIAFINNSNNGEMMIHCGIVESLLQILENEEEEDVQQLALSVLNLLCIHFSLKFAKGDMKDWTCDILITNLLSIASVRDASVSRMGIDSISSLVKEKPCLCKLIANSDFMKSAIQIVLKNQEAKFLSDLDVSPYLSKTPTNPTDSSALFSMYLASNRATAASSCAFPGISLSSMTSSFALSPPLSDELPENSPLLSYPQGTQDDLHMFNVSQQLCSLFRLMTLLLANGEGRWVTQELIQGLLQLEEAECSSVSDGATLTLKQFGRWQNTQKVGSFAPSSSASVEASSIPSDDMAGFSITRSTPFPFTSVYGIERTINRLRGELQDQREQTERERAQREKLQRERENEQRLYDEEVAAREKEKKETENMKGELELINKRCADVSSEIKTLAAKLREEAKAKPSSASRFLFLTPNTFAENRNIITRIGSTSAKSFMYNQILESGIWQLSFMIKEIKNCVTMGVFPTTTELKQTEFSRHAGYHGTPGQSLCLSGTCGYQDAHMVSCAVRSDGFVFEAGDIVMMELNMTKIPRTVHFFKNGRQCEQIYITDVPPSVRFVVMIFKVDSCVEFLAMNKKETATAKQNIGKAIGCNL